MPSATSIFEDHGELEHVVELLNEFIRTPADIAEDQLPFSGLPALRRELFALLERIGMPADDSSVDERQLNTLQEAIVEALKLVSGDLTPQVVKRRLPALKLALWKVHAIVRDSESEEQREKTHMSTTKARRARSKTASAWHDDARKAAAEIRSERPDIARNKSEVARRVKLRLHLDVNDRTIINVI